MKTATTPRQKLIDLVARRMAPKAGSSCELPDRISYDVEKIIEALEFEPHHEWITAMADGIYRTRLRRVRFLADVRVAWRRRH